MSLTKVIKNYQKSRDYAFLGKPVMSEKHRRPMRTENQLELQIMVRKAQTLLRVAKRPFRTNHNTFALEVAPVSIDDTLELRV